MSEEKKKDSTPKKESQSSTGNKKGEKPSKPKFSFDFSFNFYWVYVIMAVAFIAMAYLPELGQKDRTLTEGKLEELLHSGDVDKLVIINRKTAEIYIDQKSLEEKEEYKDVRKGLLGDALNPGPHYFYQITEIQNFDNQLKSINESLPAEKRFDRKSEDRQNWGDSVMMFLPLILIFGLFIFMMRRMSGGPGGGAQIFNIGKSKAQLFEGDVKVNVTFNDVAGLEEAKVEIKEIVDFLKKPEKYTDLGAKIPKGALLVGPPGTGKTLLAKAVAGEAEVPFFSLSGSDFVEMFVGVGASRVRDLFKQAKEKAPSIIFIDEIDAIGRARGKGGMQGANDERENTLNQLLTEMDGFGTNSGVIILAATNRADVLDRALLRAGRFDRQILVDMPDLVERVEIFKVHLKPLKLDDSVDVDFLGKQTPGFSGADIANLCNEAALIAARKDKKAIGKQDFLDAVDRIIGGLEKKNKIISKGEKKVIAYHEAGHAAVSWLVEHASPLIKVTIVPRGRSLGAAWYLPEERQITTKEQMLDEMCAALGGRAAEEIVFGKVSTGALSDLEKITKQAYAMVSVYGLSDKIGNISFYDSSGQNEYSFNKPYSEKTAELIDQEVSDMVEAAYERTKKILLANREKLEKLAEALLDKEVIFKENLELIFGKREWKTEEEVEAAKNEEGKLELSDSSTATAEPNADMSKKETPAASKDESLPQS